jgi:hypothetical protein
LTGLDFEGDVMSQPVRSSVVIAKLLDAEGFSPRTAQAIRKWIANRRKTAAYGAIVSKQRRREFAELIKRIGLSPGDRMILGKFISEMQSECFQAGLTIGLAALLLSGDGDVGGKKQEQQDNGAEGTAKKGRKAKAAKKSRTATEAQGEEKKESAAQGQGEAMTDPIVSIGVDVTPKPPELVCAFMPPGGGTVDGVLVFGGDQSIHSKRVYDRVPGSYGFSPDQPIGGGQ